MEQLKLDSNSEYAEGVALMGISKNIKKSIGEISISGCKIKNAAVKANKTDIGGNFYVFDLYNDKGHIVALNRYTYKNSDNQLFEELTEEEELELDPPVTEAAEML